MPSKNKPVRVLYSFPHKLGANRICYTAWQQVNGLVESGAEVSLHAGSLYREVPPGVKVHPTLSRGKVRLPYKALGTIRTLALHDYIVSRRLEKMAGKIDIVHTWPMAALRTIKTAAKLGIPTVLERPNAHTRFAYTAVQKECDRLGIVLPPGHEYDFNLEILAKEEEEYRLTDFLLCPSEFVARTFRDYGFQPEKLARHQYGFDHKLYRPPTGPRDPKRGLTVLFVGVAAVRKGVHWALEAWLKSPAHENGTFMIAGDFLPDYRDKLASMLAHPSVQVLGHRNDIPDLMHRSDILVLPTIEEGFPLVVAEAMGAGCVPVVSDTCTEVCKHMETGLVHKVGDVDTLSDHFTLLDGNRELLEKLRSEVVRRREQYTWSAAGSKLMEVYRDVIETYAVKGAAVQQPVLT